VNFGEHSPEDVTAALSSSDENYDQHEGNYEAISVVFGILR